MPKARTVIAMMQVGQLNRRITFLRIGETEDEIGQTVQKWEAYKTVWATLKKLRGKLYFEAKKYREQDTWKVYIRPLDGIVHGMLINYGKHTLSVESVNDVDERHDMLEIDCKEIQYVKEGDLVE